jgi:hypothetical protein
LPALLGSRESLDPQNVSPERRASDRADEILRNNQNCANFIVELIAQTAEIAIQPFNAPPTPDFRPILGPNGFHWSFEPNAALQAYNSALAQGRVTASGRSGVHGDYTTYGSTTGFNTIVWNTEFYSLSLDEKALQTVHESLHLFANFTDFSVADAAHMLATRNRTSPGTRGNFSSRDAASVYINEQIANHCQP